MPRTRSTLVLWTSWLVVMQACTCQPGGCAVPLDSESGVGLGNGCADLGGLCIATDTPCPASQQLGASCGTPGLVCCAVSLDAPADVEPDVGPPDVSVETGPDAPPAEAGPDAASDAAGDAVVE